MAKAFIAPSGRIAVIGVDPGGTTGVFCAVATLNKTMAETVKSIERVERGQVSGSFKEQSALIADRVKGWVGKAAMDYVRLDHTYVVIEDFVLRRRQQGGATGNLTSCWVAAGVDVLLGQAGFNASYQTASDAKRYATDVRLRRWKLYGLTRGMPHARDASRHWAVKVSHLIS